MKLSIIIPVYNGENTIDKCLKHVFDSDYKDFEVVVVDDGSTDSTIEKIKRHKCRIIRLKKNRGVANARNIGARNAEADFLVFIDSDILVHKETISKMAETYKSNPKMKIIGAVNSGKYMSKNFGEKFLALKISYDYKWEGKNKCRKFSSFQSECCFIERGVFDEVGGFDIIYRKAGVEEYEFGNRLIKKGYMNYVCRDILYDHPYNSLSERAYKLFRRSSIYVPLFLKKRKFESDGATGTAFEAFMALFSFFGIVTLPLGLAEYKLYFIPSSFFAVVLISNFKFLHYLLKREGAFFSFLSFFASVYLYISMSFGIALGFIKALALNKRLISKPI